MTNVFRMVLFIISHLLMHQKTLPQKRKLNLLQASTTAFGKSKQHNYRLYKKDIRIVIFIVSGLNHKFRAILPIFGQTIQLMML